MSGRLLITNATVARLDWPGGDHALRDVEEPAELSCRIGADPLRCRIFAGRASCRS